LTRTDWGFGLGALRFVKLNNEIKLIDIILVCLRIVQASIYKNTLFWDIVPSSLVDI
jgi:hypothetical protein